MAGERNYLRIPPDSSGKRIRLKHGAQVAYNNKTGGYLWKIGSRYSLSSGWDMHVHGVFEATSTTGILEVHYSKTATYTNLTPAAGDTVIDQDTSAVVATVVSATDVWINAQNIIGYDNPEYGLDIDNTGSASVRFAEGLPQLDAFGKLRVAGSTLLGEYIFSSGLNPTLFSTVKKGDATLTWDSHTRAAVLTTTTASADEVSHTSNTYHHYFPGSGHVWIGTFALGDSGKSGLTREWGLFDNLNGFFFTLIGTTLSVCVRSNASGSVVNILINQDDWNQDKLDGTGPSGMDLDLTKDNIYWMDVQWLGAGRVRFGTYYDGQRIVVHEYYHGNSSIYPVSAMGNLPVCIRQVNTSGTGSVSQMKSWCIAVWTETNIDVRTTAGTALQSFNTSITSNNTYQYIGALTPKLYLPNSQPNRSLYWPVEIEILAFDTVTGNPALVELEIVAEPVLANLSLSSVSSSQTVEYDTAGTYYGGGRAVSKLFVQGHRNTDATISYDNMQLAFKNFAANGGTIVQNITSVTNANAAVVTLGGGRTYFREGQAITINGVGGMTELNGNVFYAKPASIDTIELYNDAALTSKVNSVPYGTYTTGGNGSGEYGSRFLFSLICKKYFGTNQANVAVKISWKEVTQ